MGISSAYRGVDSHSAATCMVRRTVDLRRNTHRMAATDRGTATLHWCFETLAQLALAMTAHRALGAQQWAFCLPSASDNTAAESRTEKLWSTAEPLGSFLKLTAAWAARHHVELLVTHLAGERNTWADELSRGNTSCFRHRTAQRVSLGLHLFQDATGCITRRRHGVTASTQRSCRPAMVFEQKGNAFQHVSARTAFGNALLHVAARTAFALPGTHA